jgi:hypothetical protein
VDLDEARRLTREVLPSDQADVGYISEELIADYDASARDVETAEGDEALTPPDDEPAAAVRRYYGNHLVARPGGLLYFSNGSPNRPNDPCGQRNRWVVRMTRGSTIDPFQNCGRFWGYRMTIY